jgi:hypothetical protein
MKLPEFSTVIFPHRCDFSGASSTLAVKNPFALYQTDQKRAKEQQHKGITGKKLCS